MRKLASLAYRLYIKHVDALRMKDYSHYKEEKILVVSLSNQTVNANATRENEGTFSLDAKCVCVYSILDLVLVLWRGMQMVILIRARVSEC